MEDKPRYSRVSDIIELAVFMQSKVDGVSIKDIQERYAVSRRTAERMRDSLMNIFPSVMELSKDGAQKKFGFANYSINELISFTPKEIGNIEQLQRRTTNKEFKRELQKTVEKLKALNKKRIDNMEKRIELYMQTEGYAIRQMPQYKIDLNIIEIIREAIHNNKKVIGGYHNKKRILEPLGLIYGRKIYLIAKEKEKGNDIYNYLLHKIENPKITDETFDKGLFNLQEYASQSFGVYHGEILDVKLRFSKEKAEEAMNYDFHPTQKITKEKDGSVTVTFKASGSKEIIWHVFTWGKDCKIIEPKILQKEYKNYLKECLENF